MDKDTLTYLIDDPSRISETDLDSLEDIVADYPYFQVAHILIAKGMKQKQNMLLPQKVRRAAAYAFDRNRLRKFMEAKNEEYVPLNQKITIVSKTPTPEEFTQSTEEEVNNQSTQEEFTQATEEKIENTSFFEEVTEENTTEETQNDLLEENTTETEVNQIEENASETQETAVENIESNIEESQAEETTQEVESSAETQEAKEKRFAELLEQEPTESLAMSLFYEDKMEEATFIYEQLIRLYPDRKDYYVGQVRILTDNDEYDFDLSQLKIEESNTQEETTTTEATIENETTETEAPEVEEINFIGGLVGEGFDDDEDLKGFLSKSDVEELEFNENGFEVEDEELELFAKAKEDSKQAAKAVFAEMTKDIPEDDKEEKELEKFIAELIIGENGFEVEDNDLHTFATAEETDIAEFIAELIIGENGFEVEDNDLHTFATAEETDIAEFIAELIIGENGFEVEDNDLHTFATAEETDIAEFIAELIIGENGFSHVKDAVLELFVQNQEITTEEASEVEEINFIGGLVGEGFDDDEDLKEFLSKSDVEELEFNENGFGIEDEELELFAKAKEDAKEAAEAIFSKMKKDIPEDDEEEKEDKSSWKDFVAELKIGENGFKSIDDDEDLKGFLSKADVEDIDFEGGLVGEGFDDDEDLKGFLSKADVEDIDFEGGLVGEGFDDDENLKGFLSKADVEELEFTENGFGVEDEELELFAKAKEDAKEAAEAIFSKMKKDIPEDENITESFALKLFHEDKQEEAIEVYQKLIKKYPEKQDYYQSQINVLNSIPSEQKSTSFFDNLDIPLESKKEEVNPEKERNQIEQEALDLVSNQKPEEALEIYKKLILRYPEKESYYLSQIEILEGIKEYSEEDNTENGGSFFDTFLTEEEREEDLKISESAAIKAFQEGNLEEAIKIYKKLILKEPEKKNYYESQVNILIGDGQEEKTKEDTKPDKNNDVMTAKTEVKEEPKPFFADDEEEITEAKAIAAFNTGDLDKSIKIYEQLMLKFPEKKSYFASQIEILKS